MPITTLDPRTALVVIDLQKGIAAYSLVPPASEIIARAATLARAFRKANLPVVLVNVEGRAPGRTDQGAAPFNPPPGFSDLVPELDHQPTDVLITKYTWGAFHGTGLDMQLRRRGVTQIVLCGISTSAGVETTARAAYEHGYHVTLAVDAMTDPSLEAHKNSVERIFPKLGETGTTDDILARLASR